MIALALTPLDQAPRGKFVLLRHGGKVHFVCASLKTHPFHAVIVHAYVQEQGRGEAVLLEKAFCAIHSPDWKILGGGYYEADFAARIFRLHGKSTAYGKYPAQELAPRLGALMRALGLPDFDPILA